MNQLNRQNFTLWFIEEKLKMHLPFFRMCSIHESNNGINYNRKYTLGLWDGFTMEISCSPDGIDLIKIELPEKERGKGYAVEILKILKRAANPNKLTVTIWFPENKSFWSHYNKKYGGVIFKYRKWQRRIK